MDWNTKKYTVEELVADEGFQNYCLNKNEDDVRLWEDVILSHWNQKSTFEKANNIIVSLSDNRVFDNTKLSAKVVSMAPKQARRSPLKKYMLVASSFLVVAMFYIGSSFFQQPETVMITQSTNQGEAKKVILPDGSIANLRGNSSLTYPTLMDHTRKVSFEGEVFFEIKTKEDKQFFTVSGAYGEIIVTGTKFNLKHRNSIFEATLVEGSIIYRKENMEDIHLQPSDQLNFAQNEIRIRKVDTEVYTDSSQGRMIYKNVMIKDIIEQMKEDYGLMIIVKNDNLNSKKISANMITADPIKLLESIGLIYDFEVEKSGDKVILK